MGGASGGFSIVDAAVELWAIAADSFDEWQRSSSLGGPPIVYHYSTVELVLLILQGGKLRAPTCGT
jgi:hypothetical protein